MMSRGVSGRVAPILVGVWRPTSSATRTRPSASSGLCEPLPRCSTGRSGSRCRRPSSGSAHVGWARGGPRRPRSEMNRHTSGCIRHVSVEEDAAILRHRRVVAEQVLEHARVRPRRVRRLRHLRQLQRVAEQDQVARRRAGGERVGERELAGLVDHEVVELARRSLGREQPRRAGDEPVSPDRGSRVLARRSRPGRRRDAAAGCAGGLARTAEVDAALVGGVLDSSSSLLIARWLSAVTPDPMALRRSGRRSAARRCTSCPVPGGPCTSR